MLEISNLQKEIDKSAVHSLIKLFPREYEGPITINKPLTIEGNGSTLWSRKGPVVILESCDISLKDLKIEVTCEHKDREGRYAIHSISNGSVNFKNIELKGSVSGISGEDGEWIYTVSVELGEIPSGKKTSFSIKLIVPVCCEIISNIAGLDVSPVRLSPGANEITLTLEELSKNTLINGSLYLTTKRFKRKITVCGYVTDKEVIQSVKQLLWMPSDNKTNLPSDIIEMNRETVKLETDELSSDEEIYYEKLKEVWEDKILEAHEEELKDLLEVISISPEKAKFLEERVKKELGIIPENPEIPKYQRLVENFSSKGVIDSKKREILFKKAQEFGISVETAIEIEIKVYTEKRNNLRNNGKEQESLIFLEACKSLSEEVERLKEEKRLEEEVRVKAEEERRKREEARVKAEEDRKRQEEARIKAEEERKKREEEARIKAEEERKKREEETRIKDEEETDNIPFTNTIPQIQKSYIKPEMLYIKGGTFKMGSNRDGREQPVHNVIVSSFYMGKYEVTNREFCLFAPSHDNPGDDLPVVNVSWDESVGYCNWLSKNTGENYRLPREAEWEYACRAGTTTEYYWGNRMDDAYCWYYKNSNLQIHPVGQKKPNAWGLYDMSGNVCEWCNDWYGNYSSEGWLGLGSVANPTGPKSGSYRVLRGGDCSSGVVYCRSAYRYVNYPDGWDVSYGFRLVRSAP